VFGDVNNQGAGRVSISGNADVTFWDDVSHTGALFNVAAGSSVTFFGTAGFGISGGGDVFFEADITPGASPGLETFGGNVYFGALANLHIELGGAAQGSQYDALDIAGIASLGGTLDVMLIDLGGGEFSPSVGDEFEIISAAAGVTGEFALEDLPALSGDLSWIVHYNANSVVLEVASAGLPGDYNDDGSVDAADYIVWRKNEGTANVLPNDPIGGTIGPAHFDQWQANFGATSSGSASHSVVPEPSCWLLLAASSAFLLVLRRAR
jgi:hypothetical protein